MKKYCVYVGQPRLETWPPNSEPDMDNVGRLVLDTVCNSLQDAADFVAECRRNNRMWEFYVHEYVGERHIPGNTVARCRKCNDVNEYAEPKPDFVCYGCRR